MFHLFAFIWLILDIVVLDSSLKAEDIAAICVAAFILMSFIIVCIWDVLKNSNKETDDLIKTNVHKA